MDEKNNNNGNVRVENEQTNAQVENKKNWFGNFFGTVKKAPKACVQLVKDNPKTAKAAGITTGFIILGTAVYKIYTAVNNKSTAPAGDGFEEVK